MKKMLTALTAVSLLICLSGCSGDIPAEIPETKTVTAEYRDHYAGITMEIPEDWEFAVIDEIQMTDDPDIIGRGGIEFWPEDQPDARMGLYYYAKPYGICGTGVTTEKMEFTSGHKATLYWEELGESSYAYVFYKDTPGEYLFEAHYIPTEFWQTERETILAILDTAVVGDGALPESEAFAVAEAECTKKYPLSSRRSSFDHLTGQWTFEFHGSPGVVLQSVTVAPDGTVVP